MNAATKSANGLRTMRHPIMKTLNVSEFSFERLEPSLVRSFSSNIASIYSTSYRPEIAFAWSFDCTIRAACVRFLLRPLLRLFCRIWRRRLQTNDTVLTQKEGIETEPADASNHSPRVTPAADAPVSPRSDGR